MDSLIDDIKFSRSSLDIDSLLKECRGDYGSEDNPSFVGICISEGNGGVNIQVRHSCESEEKLMLALQGAINLFFASHSKEEK